MGCVYESSDLKMSSRISVACVGRCEGRKIFSIVVKKEKAKTYEIDQVVGTCIYYPGEIAHLTLDTAAIKRAIFEGAIPTEKANYYLSKVDFF